MWKYEFIILWQPSVMVHNAGAYTFHFGIFLNIKLSTDDDLNICVYWAHGNKVYCKGGAIISVTSSFWRTNRYFLRVLYMVLYWVSSYYTTQLIVTHRSWVYTMASSSYIQLPLPLSFLRTLFPGFRLRLYCWRMSMTIIMIVGLQAQSRGKM